VNRKVLNLFAESKLKKFNPISVFLYMKKSLVRYSLFVFLLIFGSAEVFAQQGFGTNTPSKASAVDMQGSDKGLLIPRVALIALNSFTPITGETSTETAKTNSLLVYNTATVNDVTPGYYYWTTDGVTGKWNRLITLDEVPETIEPWNKQGTTDPATLNSDNIYQTGSVAIGKNSVFSTAKLDVAGAVRGGSNQQGVVGANSVAFGNMNTASGQNSVAFGNMNVASANNSVVSGGMANQAQAQYAAVSGGNNNQAQAQWSVVSGGTSNVASGMYSIVSGGENNQAQGRWSVVAGGNSNYALSAYEWVGGAFSTSYAPNSQTNWDNDDRLFNIGNGDDMVRRDAFTILKNGKTGVGFSNFETVTFPQLFQVNGSVRITELYDEVGDIDEDKIVVVDADGVLATLEISDITTTANNGLTKTDNNIQLGGQLEDDTVIDLNGNTLAIEELPAGTSTDSMVVADPTTGVLKKKKAPPMLFYMPPVIFDTSTTGNNLTRDIYQDYVDLFEGNTLYIARGAGAPSMQYTGGLIKSSGAPDIPIYEEDELWFYVIYYDTDVFAGPSGTGKPTIDANGVLSYSIIGTATEASYMTIAFSVRD
jgi:hypothetical protein